MMPREEVKAGVDPIEFCLEHFSARTSCFIYSYVNVLNGLHIFPKYNSILTSVRQNRRSSP